MSLFKRKNQQTEQIELSSKHKWPRLVAICVLLVIAAISLSTALLSFLNGEPGWRIIEVSTAEVNCSQDFVLSYYFENTGNASRGVNNRLIKLYSQASEDAYWLFNAEETKDSLGNIHHVNAHVNEVVTVEGAVYDALQLLEAQGGRHMYLAPIYTEYKNLYFSETDEEASNRDPVKNGEMLDYFQEILTFANDPEMISLEFLGNDQLRLNVAEGYLQFAGENEFDVFIDLSWMKNAFIVDYFADKLTEAGLTDGYIASSDGFTRNLHTAGKSYSFNVFDRVENGVYLAARMEYSKPMSIVYLRDYPLGETDRWRYYTYAGGRIVTPYIDPADGCSKASMDNLVSYSENASCARILMELLPIYVAETADMTALQSMAEDSVYSIWCEDTYIRYNDRALKLYDLHEGDGLKYTQAIAE